MAAALDKELKDTMESLSRSVKPETIKSTPLRDPKNRWKEFLLVEKMEENAFLPIEPSGEDVGYDIRSYESYLIQPWKSVVVRTAIKINVPKGVYARISSRSGLAAKYNIEVGAGTIDPGYQGEILVVLRNFSDSEYRVQQGDKIAQMVLTRCLVVPMKNVKSIFELVGKSERGTDGFGSSGK